jgi:Fe-S cluster biogenesis protein NfuA
LAKVRPALQADGGDIELIAVEGSDARVLLKGACHG